MNSILKMLQYSFYIILLTKIIEDVTYSNILWIIVQASIVVALTVWRRFWWPKALYREKIPETLRKWDTAKICLCLFWEKNIFYNTTVYNIYVNVCCHKL